MVITMNSNLTLEKFNKLHDILDSLRNAAAISKEELNAFYTPWGNGSNESIFERLCGSLQNSGQMVNTIKFYGENENLVKEITFDYDLIKFRNAYSSWEEIYVKLTNNGKLDKGTHSKETNWEKYAKGLYTGAYFLMEENGLNQIKKLISLSDTMTEINDETILQVKSISSKIHGLGFALTCDWLKECGCTWLTKPDVHIIEVYKHLVGLDSNSKVSNLEIIKDFFDYAQLIKSMDPKMTAYKLDKMIWLICTGNFYLYDKKLGRDLIIKNV